MGQKGQGKLPGGLNYIIPADSVNSVIPKKLADFRYNSPGKRDKGSKKWSQMQLPCIGVRFSSLSAVNFTQNNSAPPFFLYQAIGMGGSSFNLLSVNRNGLSIFDIFLAKEYFCGFLFCRFFCVCQIL